VVNVNSYHDHGAYEGVPGLSIVACADDNVVEAVVHNYLPIRGIMWHPEREENFSDIDLIFLGSILTYEKSIVSNC